MNGAFSLTDPLLFDAIDATWPAAGTRFLGPVALRQGAGGGSRVSSATVSGDFTDFDLEAACAAMRQMGQNPLFMIRDGDAKLDRALDERGFQIKDPVYLRMCAASQFATTDIPHLATFDIWPPLAVQSDIWTEGGIDRARHAIMERSAATKTSIFGRVNDQPAATAFVGIHDSVAMLHALEVRSQHRRQGLGKWMMHHAARWALQNGATQLAVLVTVANTGANAMYQRLGLEVVGRYHYRELNEPI